MKKPFLLAVLALSGFMLRAQVDTTPAYKRFPTIPPFSLVQLDKKVITKESLHKNQPTIIMFFSPTCEHCKHQVEDMLKRIKDFSKFQIVMATWQPEEEMAEFYKEYGLAKYHNIIVGRDTKFILPPFYQIHNLPYLAMYDKKGRLLKTFEGNVKVDDMLKPYKN